MAIIPSVLIQLSLLTFSFQDRGNDNSISYQKIISCEGVSKETLFNELTAALYQIYDSADVIIVSEGQLQVQVDIKVYNRLVGKVGNPAGVLDFTFVLEVKDGKFKYQAHNYYFTPMERDRYGRYQMSNQKPDIVSEENYDHKQSLLKKIKKQSKEYHKKLNKRLENEVMEENEKEIEW